MPPNFLATSPECWSYASRIILTSFLFGPGTPGPWGAANTPAAMYNFDLSRGRAKRTFGYVLRSSCLLPLHPVLSCALYDCFNASVQMNSRCSRLEAQLSRLDKAHALSSSFLVPIMSRCLFGDLSQFLLRGSSGGHGLAIQEEAALQKKPRLAFIEHRNLELVFTSTGADFMQPYPLHT